MSRTPPRPLPTGPPPAGHRFLFLSLDGTESAYSDTSAGEAADLLRTRFRATGHAFSLLVVPLGAKVNYSGLIEWPDAPHGRLSCGTCRLFPSPLWMGRLR